MVQDPDNDRQDGGYIKQVIEGRIEPVSADLISLVILLRGDQRGFPLEPEFEGVVTGHGRVTFRIE